MNKIVDKFFKGHKGKEIIKHEGNFSLMVWSTAASLSEYSNFLRYYSEKNFGPLIFIIKGDHGIGFFSFDSYKRATEETLNKYLRNKEEFIEMGDWEIFEKEVKEMYDKYTLDEISKLDEKELVALIKKTYDLFRGAQVMTLFCEALNEEIVKKYFENVKDGSVEFSEFFEMSSLICFESLISQLDKSLLSFNKENPYNSQWVLGNYLITPGVSEVENLIEKMISEKGGLEKIKKEQEKSELEVKENKEIINRFKEKLDGKLKDLFEYTQLCISLRDVRKKTFFKGITMVSNAVRELFSRQGLKKEDAHYALYYDFDDKTYKKDDYKKIIEKRKKGFLTYFDEEGHLGEFVDFEKTKDELFGLMDKRYGDQVKGSTGCKGLASGKVKIVLNKSDFDKFEKGDVLVTSMTRPEFVPVMKLASAVVTDEGGITCHAAIISRELKIPCIIGSRNATRVLKDNQEVEVDADKGVVKVLEK